MDFQTLVDSRKEWIASVLIPWCRQAPRRELLKAEQEWGDIAGRIDPARSLWLWAWSRFPAVYVEGLPGLDETYEMRVTLHDGRSHTGFIDSRNSARGLLVLFTGDEAVGPFSIDDVQAIERVDVSPGTADD